MNTKKGMVLGMMLVASLSTAIVAVAKTMIKKYGKAYVATWQSKVTEINLCTASY